MHEAEALAKEARNRLTALERTSQQNLGWDNPYHDRQMAEARAEVVRAEWTKRRVAEEMVKAATKCP